MDDKRYKEADCVLIGKMKSFVYGGCGSDSKEYPKDIEAAFRLGLLRKSELKDKGYYLGDCRNASCAIWCARLGVFLYNRYKFGSTYVEDICHPEDDNGYDLFFPIRETAALADEIISEKDFLTFGVHE